MAILLNLVKNSNVAHRIVMCVYMGIFTITRGADFFYIKVIINSVNGSSLAVLVSRQHFGRLENAQDEYDVLRYFCIAHNRHTF